jgi:hypothetical protein
MNLQLLETDYLIIGSGAMGMAFADVILTESDARIIMVDRHAAPGGHWNDAYPFVRLHQPSTRYGVNSRRLGNGLKDEIGLNQGLDELASGAEVMSYFDQVMHQQFLPTGRVQFFPMSHYAGDGKFVSLLSGDQHHVTARKRIVDTTLMNLVVPSTQAPQFELAPGVSCVPLNDLPKLAWPAGGYVVVGAGKTGVDACLWLLGNGVAPDAIRWIMPRDAWFTNRANVQSDDDSMESNLRDLANQVEAMAQADSPADLYARLSHCGHWLRLDERVEPTMFRCATVTQAELNQLRRIKDIVRLGRVQRVERDRIILDRGTVPANPGSLYVHCSAVAFKSQPSRKAFAGNAINIQMLRSCQPVFSAAITAHIELAFHSDAEKNALCQPVPLPEEPIDWLKMWAVNLANSHAWGKDENLRAWLCQSRLDGLSAAIARIAPGDAAKIAQLNRYRAARSKAMVNVRQLLAQVDDACVAA